MPIQFNSITSTANSPLHCQFNSFPTSGARNRASIPSICSIFLRVVVLFVPSALRSCSPAHCQHTAQYAPASPSMLLSILQHAPVHCSVCSSMLPSMLQYVQGSGCEEPRIKLNPRPPSGQQPAFAARFGTALRSWILIHTGLYSPYSFYFRGVALPMGD